MKLSHLLAVIIWNKHNFQMIHWNVVGEGFKNVHEASDGYIETLEDHVDRVAEFIRMLDLEEPIPTLSEVDAIIREDPIDHVLVTSKHITRNEAWATMADIFDDLIKSCQAVYDNVPTDIQSELDVLMYFYRTEGMFKCKATVLKVED